MPQYELREGYVPGAIGRIAELHGVCYHDEWGFDLFFEAKMATELADDGPEPYARLKVVEAEYNVMERV